MDRAYRSCTHQGKAPTALQHAGGAENIARAGSIPLIRNTDTENPMDFDHRSVSVRMNFGSPLTLKTCIAT